ncbi:hypothetical protein PoB_002829900 [Plakobranchus ocellatus]|uniref:Uncharacterized protein n=1 Tax=Plakobranchus ocellatus TaxID=259542 RepID=A0AAV4A5C9_9GAST|nr:hypothetical protein PoB_002829900 [Plakobranchus ocellatus]
MANYLIMPYTKNNQDPTPGSPIDNNAQSEIGDDDNEDEDDNGDVDDNGDEDDNAGDDDDDDDDDDDVDNNDDDDNNNKNKNNNKNSISKTKNDKEKCSISNTAVGNILKLAGFNVVGLKPGGLRGAGNMSLASFRITKPIFEWA